MKIMMLKLSSLYKKDNVDDKDNDGEGGSNGSANFYESKNNEDKNKINNLGFEKISKIK